MPVVCNFFDAYERRARFYPMVLVIMPLAFGIGSWVPKSFDLPALAGSVVFAIAAAALLAQMARDQGKKQEQKLFDMWSGKPSVRALSYAGGFFEEATLARYHAKLRCLDPNLKFPLCPQEEADAPEKFQAVYKSANDILLGRTRDQQKFRLVFEENVNYGFRRNLWGMKATGIAMAVLGLAAGAWRLLADANVDGPLRITAIAAIAVSLLMFVVWLMRVRPSWVRLAADAFARQLVGGTELLGDD